MRIRWLYLAAAAFSPALVVGPASAQQVGYPPERSPFRDLEYRQELTLSGGQFSAAKDPAGVAPRSGPTIGVRYEANVGGPLNLFARLSHVRSERMVVDPEAPAATRELGVRSWPVYIADFGIGLNLTGRKSYRRVVPVVNLGFGLASDAGRKADEDPFTLGTAFSLTYGLGLKVVPGGRFQLRLGLDRHAYRIRYPTAYYTPAEDATSVVDQGQARGFWKHNTALTVGGSVLFLR